MLFRGVYSSPSVYKNTLDFPLYPSASPYIFRGEISKTIYPTILKNFLILWDFYNFEDLSVINKQYEPLQKFHQLLIAIKYLCSTSLLPSQWTLQS